MASLNIAIVAGNMTRDPELRFTPKGTPVADFAVAVNHKWKNQDGELQEEVNFFNCTAFSGTAETIAKYFRKGDPILIHGRLKQDSWDDKQTGQKRTAIKILAEKFMFCGKNKGSESPDEGDGEQQEAPPQNPRQDQSREAARRGPAPHSPQRAAEPPQGQYVPPEDDDVPF